MKNLLLLSFLLVMSLVGRAQQPVVFTGPTVVTNGQTATYTTNIPPGYPILWNVSNGTLASSGATSLLSNSNSMTVTWNTTACGSPVTGSLSAVKFLSWPPSSSPTHAGGLSVSIQVNPCPPPTPPTCAQISAAFESVWNNPMIPSNQKCSILHAIYNSAVSSGLQDSSCLNWHGCP